jgi:hypothetical protein
MQGATDDRDSMAQFGESLEHACVANIRGGCHQAGAHGEAERVAPSKAVQLRGATEGRVPRQGCEHVGDRTARGHNDKTVSQERLQAAGCGDQNRIRGDRAADSGPQTTCPHSFAGWREMDACI